MIRMVAFLLVCIPLAVARAEECSPSFNPRGPNAAIYGADQNYPLASSIRESRRPGNMVASFTHFEKLLPGSTVAAPQTPSALARNCAPFNFDYKFNGETATIEDYLARNPTTGLLIAKDSTILLERYQYGRRDTDRFVSQSMAKTITAMLFGVAFNDRKIRSLDDLAQDYVPAMKGSAYGETTLRSLLTMSSGVAYTEIYDGNDDSAKFGRALMRRGTPGAAVLLRGYNNREVPQGTRFAYAGSQTEALGLVLMAATGQSLSAYAAEKLWKPMGAEAEAVWSMDGTGKELAYCCFNARLRDYARLGLLLANDGGGVLPADFVREATSAKPDSYLAPRKATPFFGYGYQTWIVPAQRRMFALRGTHGQAIFVDPLSKLVLVHTAVRMAPRSEARELNALWYALAAKFAPQRGVAQ